MSGRDVVWLLTGPSDRGAESQKEFYMATQSLSQIRFRNAACFVAFFAALFVSFIALPNQARAQNTYTAEEIVDSGHRLIGSAAGGLASAVETAFQSCGRPNA